MKSRIYRAASAFGHVNFTTKRGRAQSLLSVNTGATPFLGQKDFHSSRSWQAVRPYILADIGEGMSEWK
jgi:hypothetical protein